MKKYLINIIILFFNFILFSQSSTIISNNELTTTTTIRSYEKVTFYRSNSNGLALVIIDIKKGSDYKYLLEQHTIDDRIQKKILYKDLKEIKKWEYFYNEKFLIEEHYYKDDEIKEKYFYDSAGHKIKQIDYKNGKPIKEIKYNYNKDGLVSVETITNLLSNQETILNYKYDSAFRIKQIEKKFPDGKVVYWESFFTNKGIITKEFYTLSDEIYTFWYNEYGQEVSGEIRIIIDNKPADIKKSWEYFYAKSGIREKKIENDYIKNLKTIIWYEKNQKERRIEIYQENKLISIETYKYNEDEKIVQYKIIKDLNISEINYEYDDNKKLKREVYYEDNKLKKIVNYNQDETKDEIIYAKNNLKIFIRYNKDGKIIEQFEIKL